jgi:hypothetical protein
MHIINLKFFRFDKTPFSILFRAIGVYVIWDSRQIIRPSYIGEGNILERFAKEHTRRFSRPIDGYVAIWGDISNRSHKPDVRISERLLLKVAELIDRYPTVNKAPGFLKPIRDVFENHGVLKINATGYDPFFRPWSPHPLNTKKFIHLRRQGNQIEITHSWRRRS